LSRGIGEVARLSAAEAQRDNSLKLETLFQLIRRSYEVRLRGTASERERVFERFYRGEGAAELARDTSAGGLGLAIVRAIADRHHALVSLHTAASGSGLEVRVVFERSAGQWKPHCAG